MSHAKEIKELRSALKSTVINDAQKKDIQETIDRLEKEDKESPAKPEKKKNKSHKKKAVKKKAEPEKKKVVEATKEEKAAAKAKLEKRLAKKKAKKKAAAAAPKPAPAPKKKKKHGTPHEIMREIDSIAKDLGHDATDIKKHIPKIEALKGKIEKLEGAARKQTEDCFRSKLHHHLKPLQKFEKGGEVGERSFFDRLFHRGEKEKGGEIEGRLEVKQFGDSWSVYDHKTKERYGMGSSKKLAEDLRRDIIKRPELLKGYENTENKLEFADCDKEQAEGRMNREGKYRDGGKIENQYEGKTAAKIWDEWTPEQKTHFLTDHIPAFKHKHISTVEIQETIALKYSELPNREKQELEYHIEEGEYRDGGKIPHKSLVIKKGYKMPHGYRTAKANKAKKDYSEGTKVEVKPGSRATGGYEVVPGKKGKQYDDGGAVAAAPAKAKKKGNPNFVPSYGIFDSRPKAEAQREKYKGSVIVVLPAKTTPAHIKRKKNKKTGEIKEVHHKERHFPVRYMVRAK